MFKQAGIGLALACVVAASATAAATGWRVVKSGSSSGDFAVKAISASVNHPKAMEVRLLGRVTSGNGTVACSKNFGIASWSRTYTRAGTYRLPQTRNADNCQIVASVGGSGRVTVQILAYR